MEIWHMSGAGNDFIAADARQSEWDYSSLAKELCKLTDADGFLALDRSQEADFRLHFYNSDGSRAAMCGNGIRCICRFAWEKGLAGESMTVQTDAGILPARRITAEDYRVGMPVPGSVELWRKPGIAYTEVGVPHAVCAYAGDLWADAETLRPVFRKLRLDAAFPQGANINFYTRTGKNSVRVLTYERGVEDFTQACGTGCCAVAAVLWAEGNLPGGRLAAQNRGGELTVTLDSSQGRIRALQLQGEAKILEIRQI